MGSSLCPVSVASPCPEVWLHLLREALALALGSDGDWDKQHQAELWLPITMAQGEKLRMSKDIEMGAALVSPPGSKAFVRVQRDLTLVPRYVQKNWTARAVGDQAGEPRYGLRTNQTSFQKDSWEDLW